MPWSKTGGIHNHAQSGLSDNGRAIKGLNLCAFLSAKSSGPTLS